MSTEIPKQYEPNKAENKWYSYWMQQGYFHSVPDGREPYTVVIPPPNVTGVLHMGHMLNNTIQDVLVRRARMRDSFAVAATRLHAYLRLSLVLACEISRGICRGKDVCAPKPQWRPKCSSESRRLDRSRSRCWWQTSRMRKPMAGRRPASGPPLGR